MLTFFLLVGLTAVVAERTESTAPGSGPVCASRWRRSGLGLGGRHDHHPHHPPTPQAPIESGGGIVSTTVDGIEYWAAK